MMNGFQVFLSSGDNQFGFKKRLCRNAIFTARNIVDQYIKGGNTANLCAIDLSKAFDKINHHEINEETHPHKIFRNVRKLVV